MSGPKRLRALMGSSDPIRPAFDAHERHVTMPAEARASLEARVIDIAAGPTSTLSLVSVAAVGSVVVGGLAIVWMLWPASPQREVLPSPTKAAVTAPAFRPAIEPPTPAPSQKTRAQATRPRVEKPPVYSLSAERALLKRASSRIRSDPRAALAFIEEHQNNFAHGQLIDLREYIAIQAHDELGASSMVRIRAARFLVDHPTSAFGRDVRAILARHR